MGVLKNGGLEHLWAQIISKLNTKVDKVDGKGLSTNDYTTEDKNKVLSSANSISQLETDLTAKASQTIIRIW